VEICPNDQGSRITPSYVSFSHDGTRLTGDAAKNAAPSNPTNTVFDVKRLIGRKYKDPSVQSDKKLFPYEIVEDKDGKPSVKVMVGTEQKMMSPEEVSGMVRTPHTPRLLTQPPPHTSVCGPTSSALRLMSPHSFIISSGAPA